MSEHKQPWEKGPLSDVFCIGREQVFPSRQPKATFTHYSIPAWDEFGGPSIELGEAIESNKTAISVPSVLVSKLNPRKPRVAVIEAPEKRTCCSTEFICYQPQRAGENLRFWGAYLYSQEFSARLARVAIGSTNSHTRASPRETLGWLVPSVPLAEQEVIAQILDTLDIAIRETEALVDKLKAVRQGLLHDLLTRGIDASGQLRQPQSETPQLYKESSLGWIPREWEVAAIGSKVHVIDPNPSHRYPLDQEDGVPICSTENFEGEDDFDLSRSKRMPNSVFMSQKSRCGFSADDVVFARKGRIGLARRYGEDQKVFSHTIVTLTPKTEDVDRKWLLWLARSEVFLGGISFRMNSNSGVPTLGIELINSVLTPFPSRHEQAQISQVLDDAAERLRIEQEQLVAQRQMKAGLMDDLLTGRVRVTPLLKSAQQTAAPIVQQPVGQTGD